MYMLDYGIIMVYSTERIDINIRKILTMGNLYFFKKETNKNTKETDKKQ